MASQAPQFVPVATESSMNQYLAIALAIAVYTGHALRTLVIWLLYPFRPVWYFLYILLLPAIHILNALWTMVSYPARLFPGSLVETMYIFLSTAVIVGIITGAALLLVHQGLVSFLHLDRLSLTPQKPRPAKRTMADYRTSRKQRKESIRNTPLTDVDDLGYVSPKSVSTPTGHLSPSLARSMTDTQLKWARRSLITSPTTIVEEGSSEDYF